MAAAFMASACTAQVSLIGFGRPTNGSDPYPVGISANGNVVVGYTNHPGSERTFRLVSGSYLNLTGVFGYNNTFLRCDATASTILLTPNGVPAIWRLGGSLETLPSAARSVRVSAIAPDGSAVYGQYADQSAAVRYRASDGWTVVSGLVPDNSINLPVISSVASNGAHTGAQTVGVRYFAYRRSQEFGIEIIGVLPGGTGSSNGTAISSDGSTVVGVSDSQFGGMAFRWQRGLGIVGLGYGVAGDSYATDVSADGSVIVGLQAMPVYGYDVFVWTQATGKFSLRDYLQAHGVPSVMAWSLHWPGGAYAGPYVSDDGRKIVGRGRNQIGLAEPWLANIGNIGAPTVSGRIVFLGLNAIASPPSSATVEFRRLDGSLAYSEVASITTTGQFVVSSPVERGVYDVAIKVSHWLRKVVPVDTGEGNVSGLSFRLLNGDADEDNEVGIGDYAVLSGSYGTSRGDTEFVGNADFNGDDAVDIADYAILSENYGRAGDP